VNNFEKAIKFSLYNDVNFLVRKILSYEIGFGNLSSQEYPYAFEACVCELLYLGKGMECK
jgi:hypothetical protein